MKINTAIAKPIFMLIVALSMLLLPGIKLPYIDKNTDAYFNESMKKAGVAYGACRLVNASVSVIKESHLQIEPAGIGVSLAAGQILDPLDDLTERASDILITSIVSLGIQKIAYEICVAFAPFLIGIALIMLFIISFLKGDRAAAFRAIVLKAITLVAIARLCLPASSIINAYLYEHYFSPQITVVNNELALNSPEMLRLKDMHLPAIDGVLGTLKNGYNFVEEKTSDLGAALMAMITNMGSLVSNLLKLSYLYVASFIVQVLLLPIGVFWLLTRTANALFGTRVPFILKQSDLDSMISHKGKNKLA